MSTAALEARSIRFIPATAGAGVRAPVAQMKTQCSTCHCASCACPAA